MASLSGPYRIDRLDAPSTFYTPKTGGGACGCKPGTDVLAISDEHRSPGWILLGYVSKESPFGQGTFMGFKVQDLREATPNEIRTALKRTHPHGRRFRPSCKDLPEKDEVYRKVIRNWRKITRQQTNAVLRALDS